MPTKMKEKVEISELEDLDLVSRVREGDERCIEVLLARYRNFARSKARSYFLPGPTKKMSSKKA